jgi:5'-3' exonuclease
MILADISQTLISNIMISVKSFPEINEDSIRYQVLNSIASYRRKFAEEYGELIICCDTSPSWRKEIFPHYKAMRAKSIAESPLDWKKIQSIIKTIIDELDENFPYRVVRAANAEGDDVIGTIVAENSLEIINNSNKILICSADHDFGQLQKYPNVEQYDPVFNKAKIVQRKPYEFLKEHIIRGDRGDGIPNIKSADNCFVLGIRQGSIFEKNIASWIVDDLENFCNAEMLRNYKRNERLIDLSFTPEHIRKNIIKSYEEQAGKKRHNILPYLVKHKLSKLIKIVGDF